MTSFRQQIQVFVNNELSAEANRQHLIDTAKNALATAQSNGQVPSLYTTVVDGVKTDNVDQAQKVISYQFSFAADSAVFAIAYLQNRIIQLTGKASHSLWISVNSNFILASAFDPTQVPARAEIVIGDTVAYWRKIDVNVAGGKILHYKSPGVLDDCVRAVRSRFGSNTLTVKRLTDYNFPNKYVPKHSGGHFQSPVIVITQNF